MKILLVVPVAHYKDKPGLLSISDFPTGFGYIAASLKEAGHEVYGLNPNNDTRFSSNYYLLSNKLAPLLESVKPDLIGLGGICTDYAFLKDCINLIRNFSKVPIVLGGGIVNNDREFIFTLLKPDFALVGDGEETLTELANEIQGEKQYGKIRNLSWWNGDVPIFNAIDHFHYRDINKYPFPDYDPFGGLGMVNNYSMETRLLYRYSRTHPRPFTIVTARGCPFNCTFCVHRGGAPYRPRSIENIKEEIRVTYEKYKFNILVILDELFAVNKQRMKEFCEMVLEGKKEYGWDFDWSFQTHASAALDLDTLKLAKQAGCVFFSYGLESASPKVLESMNKRTKPEQISEAIKLASEAGIGFGGNMIFGDIVETEFTIAESLNFYYKYCTGAFVFLSNLTPYPGNKLFDFCVARGLITDKKVFYERLDEITYNMTCMPNELFGQWMGYFATTEKGWLHIKDTQATSVEYDEYTDPVVKFRKGKMWKVKAICPYCNEEIEYREIIGRAHPDQQVFLGTGCPKCNKRIKVNLKVPMRVT